MGGAFKPRTSPYSFQGLGIEGLQLFRQVADCYGMGVVSELLDLSLLDTLYPYVDVIQVGSRNMFNYHLLKELGKVDKPILLKRGMFATVEEWLLAAEYILAHGNDQVILCERGIRSFDPYFRNLIDFNAVADHSIPNSNHGVCLAEGPTHQQKRMFTLIHFHAGRRVGHPMTADPPFFRLTGHSKQDFVRR